MSAIKNPLKKVLDEETGLTLEDWMKTEMEFLLIKNGLLPEVTIDDVESMFDKKVVKK